MPDRIVTRDTATGVLSATLDPASLAPPSLTPLLNVSMTDATTAAAQLGTPVFVRSSLGNSTWDPPATTAPVLTSGIAIPSYPSETGLSIQFAQTISGGWIYPLTGLTSIPTGGVAIEVDIANQDSDVELVVMPIARFSANTVTGAAFRHFRSLSQINSYLVYVNTGPQPFAQIAGSSWAVSYSFSATPDFNRSRNFLRYEVKAAGPATPARWAIQARAWNFAASDITEKRAGASGAADPVTDPVGGTWSGLARPTIGVGIYRLGTGTGSALLSGLRVYPL